MVQHMRESMMGERTEAVRREQELHANRCRELAEQHEAELRHARAKVAAEYDAERPPADSGHRTEKQLMEAALERAADETKALADRAAAKLFLALPAPFSRVAIAAVCRSRSRC